MSAVPYTHALHLPAVPPFRDNRAGLGVWGGKRAAGAVTPEGYIPGTRVRSRANYKRV